MRIGFIGAGKMALALMRAVRKAGAEVFAYDPNDSQRKKAKGIGVKVLSSNAEVVRKCDVIFIAVKPNTVPEVLDEIGSASGKKLFVSIAAGVGIKKIEEKLSGARVIRMMPNLNAMVGEMACAYSLGSKAKKKDGKILEGLLKNAGILVRVREDKLDVITALSGCGPAYFVLFIKELANAAGRRGLSKRLALRLAAQTALGSGKVILGGYEPDEVIKMVATPGGATERALQVFEENKFREIIEKAVEAALRRAEELRENF
ncbi:MAG: pyrroline-5-carboxylate reductase [Candidatus Micrarchaeia archaeon]